MLCSLYLTREDRLQRERASHAMSSAKLRVTLTYACNKDIVLLSSETTTLKG
jgi:hypothetical protein